MPFQKILIANRGEIALRILRTCREMGIATVAVYSDADRNAPHVRPADEAVGIGPAPAKDSYLRMESILDAARKIRAEAIHPGYGFLAENAEFAAACEREGIVFIGPPAEVIRNMGSKITARKLMAAAGVPLVPGCDAREGGTLSRQAIEIGFPVLIKAAAGGGGRGMRVVSSRAGLDDALESARREAESAFGDGTLLLEPFIPGARHVEIQILGDAHGNLLHLFERECSIQRRHQKILEESPSPALNDGLRGRMTAAALEAARAMGYTSAGTVEFLLAPSGEFYFLEVNTRIQVEHPVTEMLTGLDLVRLQIEIAEGRPLALRQSDIRTSGHAIEARLYAEDPADSFAPSAGVIYDWRPPEAAPGLRVDAAAETGMEVGIHYDPLLGKIISHDRDRQAAARKLAGALRQLSVAGIETNREFLIRTLDHPEFLRGNTSTGFVDEHYQELLEPEDPEKDFAFAAAVALFLEKQWQAGSRALRRIPPHFRNNPFRDPALELELGRGRRVSVSWRHLGGERSIVRAGSCEAEVRLISHQPQAIQLEMGGVAREYRMVAAAERFFVHSSAGSRVVRRLPRYPDRAAGSGSEAAHATLPGQVLRVLVAEGQKVKAGDPLVVMEAMKIEHTLRTHMDGTVDAILVKVGEVVAPGDLLVEISAPDGAAPSAGELE